MQLSLHTAIAIICGLGSTANTSASHAIARGVPGSPTDFALHADGFADSTAVALRPSEVGEPLLLPEVGIGEQEGGEYVRLLPGEEQGAGLKARRPALRGKKFLLAGLILLGLGVALTISGRRVRRGRTAGPLTADSNNSLQMSVQILEKLGVTSASKLAIGYILAGLIELFRSGLGKASSSTSPATGATTDEQQKPALRGRLLLALAVSSLVASLSAAGVDLSTLQWGEISTVLMEYGLQAYLGLFAAGGYEFLTSALSAHNYNKAQQQQQQQQQQQKEQQQQQQQHEQDENGEEAAGFKNVDQEEASRSNQEEGSTRSISGSFEPFYDPQDEAALAALIAAELADAAASAASFDHHSDSGFLIPEEQSDDHEEQTAAAEQEEVRGEEEP